MNTWNQQPTPEEEEDTRAVWDQQAQEEYAQWLNERDRERFNELMKQAEEV